MAGWWEARMCRIDVLVAETYVMLCVCVCVSRQSQQPLFSKPWWPCLGREMINGCFPVIYLQEDGWCWPVWLEGGETRREETVGEGGGVKTFLLWTWLGSWVSSEVRYIFKCVRLTVYLQSFTSCSVHRGEELIYPPPPTPLPTHPQTPVQPPWVETHHAVPTTCEHILSNEKHTNINSITFLKLMTAIRETDDQHNTQLIN